MLQDRLRRVLEDLLGVDMSRVTPATTLTKLGLDRAGLVDILCALEVEFDVSLLDDGNLLTFADLCAAVSLAPVAA